MLAARAVGFVKRHPVGVLLFVAVFLLLVMKQSRMSSLATLGNGPVGAFGTLTHTDDHTDPMGDEAAHSPLEADMQTCLENTVQQHANHMDAQDSDTHNLSTL